MKIWNLLYIDMTSMMIILKFWNLLFTLIWRVWCLQRSYRSRHRLRRAVRSRWNGKQTKHSKYWLRVRLLTIIVSCLTLITLTNVFMSLCGRRQFLTNLKKNMNIARDEAFSWNSLMRANSCDKKWKFKAVTPFLCQKIRKLLISPLQSIPD